MSAALWTGLAFAGGLVVGVSVGLLLGGLLASAKRGDEHPEPPEPMSPEALRRLERLIRVREIAGWN